MLDFAGSIENGVIARTKTILGEGVGDTYCCIRSSGSGSASVSLGVMSAAARRSGAVGWPFVPPESFVDPPRLSYVLCD